MIKLSVAIVKSHIYPYPQTCTALCFIGFCGAHSLKVQSGRLNFLLITIMRSYTARVDDWMKAGSITIYDSEMDVSLASTSEGKREVRRTISLLLLSAFGMAFDLNLFYKLGSVHGYMYRHRNLHSI